MTFSPAPVFLALTETGGSLARSLQQAVPGSLVHGRRGRVTDCDQPFDGLLAHAARLFEQGHPVIGICAAGILIRALASRLGSKHSDPPVVAIAEDGSSVVPLLGGHHGANALARRLAQVTGGQAAITTASDISLGFGLDDLPPGWKAAPGNDHNAFAAALMAGEAVRLDASAGNHQWLYAGKLRLDPNAQRRLVVTEKRVAAEPTALVLHPPVLALGVGCERGCDGQELAALVERTLATHNLAPEAIACVVSLDLKADEPAVHELAGHLGVPARFFDAAELERQTPRLATPSEVVFAEVGCHGVSEGAALAAAGADATLCVTKQKSARATCAVAVSPVDLEAATIGRARGRLTVVGIGPGTASWRTPAVTNALARATDVVGYGLYLDLLGGLITGKHRHQSDLAQEEDRVRQALDLAAEGRDVALVCSGDAGIYALATLVFELLDREQKPHWNRLEISVEPGVSAIQAAAARMGAPIGHDFCLISLSDLLTPWPEIERRLQAAAEGDFVVGFYNPVSKRRRHQLAKAREILLDRRPPETPVILARNLGRPNETTRFISLGELTPDHADMLTLVLVGNRQTRQFRTGARAWVYTPRGYAKKREEPVS